MMVIFRLLLACLVLWSWAAARVLADGRGWEIAREADRRDQGWGNFRADLIMELRNREGERSRRAMRSLNLEGREDGDKSLLIFQSPADVRGTKFLSFAHRRGDDDQWLYLPALGRVKRISAANKGGAFMGSEFSYEDMAAPVLEKYEYRYLGDGDFQGRPAFVVERRPRDPHSLYSRQISWIDQQYYIPWKIEYYNRRGKHLKTLVYGKYRRYLNRYWRPGRMWMVNRRTGKSTLLLWRGYRFRVPEIAAGVFDPAALPRLR